MESKKPMRVVFSSSEMVPFSKTGGLADVAGSLPQALGELGDEIYVITPRYKTTDRKRLGIRSTQKKIRIPVGDRIEEAEILSCSSANRVTVFLIEKPEYFNRDGLYQSPNGDFPDNAERFIFFSRSVLEICREFDLTPDVFHCHDWQTGLIPVYLKTVYANDPRFQNVASVFTLHNLGYQGIFSQTEYPLTGLPWDLFTPEGIEFYGQLNFLKAGLVYSDFITTVSRTYSREIQSKEQGFGLEGVLTARKNRLIGILNGIDDQAWNPEKDSYLAARFGPNRMKGKKRCKVDLLKQFGLSPKDGTPVIGIISRLVDQKGFDLIAEILDSLLRLDLQLVVLGIGNKNYEEMFVWASKAYPDRIGVRTKFDNPLAHKIEAGSDMFLMPSRYEPCGLNQMYSLRYGTVPIVRATGGLNDTVTEFSPTKGKGNGFKFKPYSSQNLFKTVKKAIKLYKRTTDWDRLVQNGIKEDFSWKQSALAYSNLYRKAVAQRNKKTMRVENR